MAYKHYKRLDFSEHETPATIRIDDYYASVGLLHGWPMHRAEKSARIVGCTLHELGKLALVNFMTMGLHIRRGRIPASLALHFAVFEATTKASRKSVMSPTTSPIAPIDFLATT